MNLMQRIKAQAEGRDFEPSRWCFIKGGGSKTQTSTQKIEIPEEFKPLLSKGLAGAEAVYDAPAKEFFPGSTVVDFNNLERESQSGILDQARGALPGLVSGAQNAANFNFDAAAAPGQNEFLKTVIDSAIARNTENFTESVLPELRTSSVTAGGFGDSRQDLIQGRAAREFGEGTARAVGDLALGQYNQDIATGLSQQQLLPGLINASTAPAQLIGGVGLQERGLEEAQLNEEIQRFNFEQDSESRRVQELLNTVYSGLGATGVNRTQTQQVQGSNPLQSIMGIASLASAFMPGMQAFTPALMGARVAGSLTNGGGSTSPWT